MARRPKAPEGGPREAVVLDALRKGNTRTAAAGYAGISRMTFYRMLDRDTFRDAVEKAEADAEFAHVANVKDAADKGNWTASAWWLERRRSNDYARREKVDLAVDLRTAIEKLTDSAEERAAALEEVTRILSDGH